MSTDSATLPVDAALDTFQEFTCSRCLLDQGDVPTLLFDHEGVCDICRRFEKKWRQHKNHRDNRHHVLQQLIDQIKSIGRNRDYDCVLGISGGIDSSYLAWKVQELGLRPLAVHFDNGWNSELAVKNIESLTSKMNIDLQTHVVD